MIKVESSLWGKIITPSLILRLDKVIKLVQPEQGQHQINHIFTKRASNCDLDGVFTCMCQLVLVDAVISAFVASSLSALPSLVIHKAQRGHFQCNFTCSAKGSVDFIGVNDQRIV